MVLIFGLVIICAMIAYPPWHCSIWAVSGPRPPAPPGTVFIPEVRIRVTRYAPILPYPTKRHWESALNFRRLAIQCVAVAGLTLWVAQRVRV